MTGLTVRQATLADGRPAVVIGYRPTATTGLGVDTAGLRRACGPDAQDVVVLCPDGSDLEALLQAATRCGADLPVLATAGPVTDAIKQVEGKVLAATVDRTTVSWVVGPAVVHGPTLRALLATWAAPTVRPLLDGGARIAWL